MKPPVALFYKKRIKLFLKTKCQAKAYQHSCMLFAQEKDVRKSVEKKIGKN